MSFVVHGRFMNIGSISSVNDLLVGSKICLNYIWKLNVLSVIVFSHLCLSIHSLGQEMTQDDGVLSFLWCVHEVASCCNESPRSDHAPLFVGESTFQAKTYSSVSDDVLLYKPSWEQTNCSSFRLLRLWDGPEGGQQTENRHLRQVSRPSCDLHLVLSKRPARFLSTGDVYPKRREVRNCFFLLFITKRKCHQ